MKTIIIGNGIDIQYGGFDERGNKAIINRAISNIEKDKYRKLGWEKDSVRDILDTLVSVINKVILNEVSIPKDQNYLFLQIELERVRRSYKNPIAINEIGLEDIFFGAEILYVNATNDEERALVKSAIHDFLQPLLLDAIYDDGKVNEIYKEFPDSLIEYLKNYDVIFTLNYDINLDIAVGAEVPVYHLHGSFKDYTDKVLSVDNKYKHMYCNGIMTWYWLEKYGEEDTDYRYAANEFNNIEGSIDILGISPCNDEQLYIRLWQNEKLKSCNYFFFERKDAVEIRKHIKGSLESHITDRDAIRFWSSFK